MSVPVIAFLSAQGRIGTTSLISHVAWMFSDLQVRVLAVDLDPQASLTSALLGNPTPAVFRDLAFDATDSLAQVVTDNLVLLPSDLRFARFEQQLASMWQGAFAGNRQALDVFLKPWQAMTEVASATAAELILVDLGPNLTAITCSGLIAADYVVIPLSPDPLFGRTLETVGSALQAWRREWNDTASSQRDLPAGMMKPLGYVVLRPSHPLAAFEDWTNWTAEYFRKFILDDFRGSGVSIMDDPYKLAVLGPYASLLAMAHEARKPMFHLKPADGAIGAHLQAAEDARQDFEALAKAIVAKANLPIVFRS